MRVFDTGATRDSDDGKLDYEGFLSPRVLKRYAEYMHVHRIQADGSLRDSDNWQKGIPRKEYMKSMWRHFMDVWSLWRKQDDFLLENALCALLFNVMGMLHATLEAKDLEVYSKSPQRRQDSDVYGAKSPWFLNAIPVPEGLGARLGVPPKYPEVPQFPSQMEGV